MFGNGVISDSKTVSEHSITAAAIPEGREAGNNKRAIDKFGRAFITKNERVLRLNNVQTDAKTAHSDHGVPSGKVLGDYCAQIVQLLGVED